LKKEPLLALLVAIVIEVGGGILLILGLRSRIGAGLMALFTVATALSFHRNFADQNAMAHLLSVRSRTRPEMRARAGETGRGTETEAQPESG
jgi:hypothetical protein